MREIQEKVYQARDAQYLLLRPPTEIVDGQFKEFIWKDGKKSPKQ